MNFDLTEDQLMVRDMVRRFASERLAPGAESRDDEGHLDQALFRELADLGLMGLNVPEAYGGSELDFTSALVAIEEIARHDGSAALIVAAHNALCAAHLVKAGTEDQKHAMLPRLCSGKALGAWAYGHPRTVTVHASRREGGWSLSGTKRFVTPGSVADLIIVLASEQGESGQGPSAFIIEGRPSGLTIDGSIETLGMRSAGTANLVFDDVFVPDTHLLGAPGRAHEVALELLVRSRLIAAAAALGLGRGALEEALSYGSERHQFGKPLTAFQAIQFKLADMAVKLDAARALVLRGAWLVDSDASIEETRAQASMAKLYASQIAVEIADEALQIHGGYGYTREYPVERMLRDARLLSMVEGSTEIQHKVIAAALMRQP
jgi:alkylation response protein AidB-like acyl-CoA dehydrogenase